MSLHGDDKDAEEEPNCLLHFTIVYTLLSSHRLPLAKRSSFLCYVKADAQRSRIAIKSKNKDLRNVKALGLPSWRQLVGKLNETFSGCIDDITLPDDIEFGPEDYRQLIWRVQANNTFTDWPFAEEREFLLVLFPCFEINHGAEAKSKAIQKIEADGAVQAEKRAKSAEYPKLREEVFEHVTTEMKDNLKQEAERELRPILKAELEE